MLGELRLGACHLAQLFPSAYAKACMYARAAAACESLKRPASYPRLQLYHACTPGLHAPAHLQPYLRDFLWCVFRKLIHFHHFAELGGTGLADAYVPPSFLLCCLPHDSKNMNIMYTGTRPHGMCTLCMAHWTHHDHHSHRRCRKDVVTVSYTSYSFAHRRRTRSSVLGHCNPKKRDLACANILNL